MSSQSRAKRRLGRRVSSGRRRWVTTRQKPSPGYLFGGVVRTRYPGYSVAVSFPPDRLADYLSSVRLVSFGRYPPDNDRATNYIAANPPHMPIPAMEKNIPPIPV